MCRVRNKHAHLQLEGLASDPVINRKKDIFEHPLRESHCTCHCAYSACEVLNCDIDAHSLSCSRLQTEAK